MSPRELLASQLPAEGLRQVRPALLWGQQYFMESL
jgi:hypothetical protein